MSRSSAIAFVFLAIMALGAVVVARQFRTVQKSPYFQRRDAQRKLRTLAEALAAYRADHRAWPDQLFQLSRDRGLPLGAAAGLNYRRPPPGAGGDVLVVVPDLVQPAVRVGDELDGGRRAETDLPAVAYVLTADGSVVELGEAEFRRRSAR